MPCCPLPGDSLVQYIFVHLSKDRSRNMGAVRSDLVYDLVSGQTPKEGDGWFAHSWPIRHLAVYSNIYLIRLSENCSGFGKQRTGVSSWMVSNDPIAQFST